MELELEKYLRHAQRVLVEHETVRHALAIDNVEGLLESRAQHECPIVHPRAVHHYVWLHNAARKQEHFANSMLGDSEAEKRLRIC